MGAQKALIVGLFAALVWDAPAAACSAPDGADKLLKTLDDFDRNMRNLKLPKSEKLSFDGRVQMIKNHILLRDMQCSGGPGPSRQPTEEELSLQRQMIRQNQQIIEELQRRR